MTRALITITAQTKQRAPKSMQRKQITAKQQAMAAFADAAVLLFRYDTSLIRAILSLFTFFEGLSLGSRPEIC